MSNSTADLQPEVLAIEPESSKPAIHPGWYDPVLFEEPGEQPALLEWLLDLRLLWGWPYWLHCLCFTS